MYDDDLDDLDPQNFSRSSLRSFSTSKVAAPSKRARPVNELLASSRREQRRQAAEGNDWSSSRSTEPFIPPPSSPAATQAPSRSLTYNPPSSSWTGPGPPPAQPITRTPAGPAPPRSWLFASAIIPDAPSTSRSLPATPLLLPQELQTSLLFDPHLHPPSQFPLYTHPALDHRSSSTSSAIGLPRLVHLTLSLLSNHLSLPPPAPSATPDEHASYQALLDELGCLPRHTREVLVWMIGKGLADGGAGRGQGLREIGVRTLMWDLREWEEEGEHDQASDGEGAKLEEKSPRSSVEGDQDEAEAEVEPESEDDWDRSSSDDTQAQEQDGWRILDLTSSHLSNATLRLLLHPVPATPRSIPTPIKSLSFASVPLSLCALVKWTLFPEHLRHLDLSGIILMGPISSPYINTKPDTRHLDAASSSSPGLLWTNIIQPELQLCIRKLAIATPLLTFLDLSYTRPRLAENVRMVANLPWISEKKPCWPELKVLGLAGFRDEAVGRKGGPSMSRTEARKMLEDRWKGRKGGWIELDM